jgi:hypothetical protein
LSDLQRHARTIWHDLRKQILFVVVTAADVAGDVRRLPRHAPSRELDTCFGDRITRHPLLIGRQAFGSRRWIPVAKASIWYPEFVNWYNIVGARFLTDRVRRSGSAGHAEDFSAGGIPMILVLKGWI